MMKNLLILSAFLLVGCQSSDDPKVFNPAPHNLSYGVSSFNFRLGMDYSPESISLFPSYRGSPADSFEITPQLPEGLQFSAISGRITGTPLELSPATSYNVKAISEFGEGQVNITIGVIHQQVFSLEYNPNTITLTPNLSEIYLIPQYFRGERDGAVLTSFSVAPAFPPGIILNSDTGIVEGAAQTPFVSRDFVITGSNSAGQISATLRLEYNVLIQDIALAGSRTCKKETDQWSCKGKNNLYQLGLGNNNQVNNFTAITGSDILDLYLGTNNSAYTTDSLNAINRKVFVFGDNSHQQLIPGNLNSSILAPTDYGDDGQWFVSMSREREGNIASGHVCGVNIFDDILRCAGNFLDFDYSSSLGVVEYGGNPVLDPETVVSGDNFFCYILSGDLYCAGSNEYNKISMGPETFYQEPQLILNLGVVKQVALGADFACVISLRVPEATDSVKCWGRNNLGQLGVESGYREPVVLSGTPTEIKAGDDFACAISGSQASCWGDNSRNQLASGEFSALQIGGVIAAPSRLELGSAHGCIIEDNKMYCWGDNSSRQILNTATPSYSVLQEVN